MRIAILSNPWIPLPPSNVGGTERVIYNLQKALHDQGHDVTVFATGDSKIESRLRYYYEKALGYSFDLSYNPYYMLTHVYHFMRMLEEEHFDIAHFHDNGRLSLYFASFIKIPFVTTLHGSYELRKEVEFEIPYEKRQQLLFFKKYPFISISESQRESLPELKYIATIYNSLPIEEFDFNPTGGDYLSWIGRVTKSKGVDMALEIAQKLNKPMILHGGVADADTAYFESTIKPLLSTTRVYKGPTTEIKQKSDFLGNARLFTFPICWKEPFGIVLIESMATGTPVVAFANGAVPEVVKDGVTGFLINPAEEERTGDYIIKKTGIAGFCEAIDKVYSMNESEYRKMRQNCRDYIVSNFSTDSMALRYTEVYESVINEHKLNHPAQ